MKNLIRRIYSIYIGIVFFLTFLILTPIFLWAIYFRKYEKYGLLANHWWAKIFFPLTFLGSNVESRFKPDKNQNYVICANHFSFFDIPSMAFFPLPFKFIGKKSVMKIPILGFIFKKLHIMVDREEARSRSGSLKRGLDTLDKGLSLMIFPEGGIFTKTPPEMAVFKDGAFKAAITKKVPIVPVTIINNHLILPDDGKYLFKRHPFKMVIHPPISTVNLTLEDMGNLKEETFSVINNELKTHFPESF